MRNAKLFFIFLALFTLSGCDDNEVIDPMFCSTKAYIKNASNHDVEIGGLLIGKGATKKVFSDDFATSSSLHIFEFDCLDFEYGHTKRIKFVYDDTITLWHSEIYDMATETTTITPTLNNFFDVYNSWRHYDTNGCRSYYYFVSDNDYSTAQRLNRNSDSR